MSRYYKSWRRIPDQPFTYLVHAIVWDMQNMITQQHIIQAWQYEEWQSINLLYEPEKIGQKKTISASLISEKRRWTRWKWGFILDFYDKQIVAAGPHDLWTSHDWSSKTEHSYHPMSTDRLLQETSPTSYNEIVITNSKQKTKIKWVFIKVDEYGYPLGMGYHDLKAEIESKFWLSDKWASMQMPSIQNESESLFYLAQSLKVPLVLIKGTPSELWLSKHMHDKIKKELLVKY